MLAKLFDIFKFEQDKRHLLANSKLSIIYSQNYNLELGEHVFPASKFNSIFEIICFDDNLRKVNIFEPEKATYEELILTHSAEYLDDFLNHRRTERTRHSELPISRSIVDSFLYGAGGTILAMRITKDYPFVFNIGGGFHHAFKDRAEGFCYLNDVAIATNLYLKENSEKKVLIIDLDLHQGNGTANIFQNNPSVFTFSMHQEDIYPKKEKSNLDIPLYPGCNDKQYLEYLKNSLEKIQTGFKPDIIFYLAGADPYKGDRLGSLKLTIDGLYERDILVKKFSQKINCPTVIVTAGGYSHNTEDTVKIHFNTARAFYEHIF